LVNLYILGDRSDDVQLRSRTVQHFFTMMQDQNMLPSLRTVELIWTSTPSGYLLRKMMVDVIVARAKREDFVSDASYYPPEFVRDVAVTCMRDRSCVEWDELVGDMPQWTEIKELR
jgi:hypothetical protein